MAEMSSEESRLRRCAANDWHFRPSPSELADIVAAGQKWWFAMRDGCSPLMLAARAGKLDVLRLILPGAPRRKLNALASAEAVMERERVGGLSALMLAAMSGRSECVELLLEAGADAFSKARRSGAESDLAGRTAVMIAAARNHRACVRLLAPRSELWQHDPQGLSAFMIAADSGAHLLLPYLAHAGCSDVLDASGRPALLLAVAGRRWDAIDALLSNHFGGSPQKPSTCGLALTLAAEMGDCVAIASLSKASGDWPLLSAVEAGQANAVGAILSLCAKPASSALACRSLLLSAHVAEESGQPKIAAQIRRMLSAKPLADLADCAAEARPRSRQELHALGEIMAAIAASSQGRLLGAFDLAGAQSLSIPQILSGMHEGPAPLMAASRLAESELARLILGRAGSDNAKASLLLAADSHGRSALHHAAEAGSAACASLLLLAGAPSELIDSNGATPAMLAAEAGHLDVLKLIRELRGEEAFAGAGFDGRTALMRAASAGRSACSAWLAAMPGSPGLQRDFLGMCPLMHAAAGGHAKAAAALLPFCDPLLLSHRGESALFIAAKLGHAECCAALADARQASWRMPCGLTPLMAAAMGGHAEAALALARHGSIDFVAGKPVGAEHDFYDRCSAAQIAQEMDRFRTAAAIEQVAAELEAQAAQALEPLGDARSLALLGHARRMLLASASIVQEAPPRSASISRKRPRF